MRGSSIDVSLVYIAFSCFDAWVLGHGIVHSHYQLIL